MFNPLILIVIRRRKLYVNDFFSYLEPGTGSIIIQSLIGIVAGVGIFGRRVFYGIGQKLKSPLSRKDKSNNK